MDERDTVVGIQFNKAGKIYYFSPHSEDLRAGQVVIVETERGLEIGTVAIGVRDVPRSNLNLPLKPVVRLATQDDLSKAMENQQRETQAMVTAEEKVRSHGLPMKLTDAQYTFDRKRVTFSFTAEGKVDFRKLVRDLASTFRTRIELRQIGARDQAKIVGGIGDCGRQLCCNTFLREFQPVSIKMAKEQGLALNPPKLIGQCGRLKCCLRYEYEIYVVLKKELPPLGSLVRVPDGQGSVVDLNIPSQKVIVQVSDGTRVEVPAQKVKVIKRPDPRNVQ